MGNPSKLHKRKRYEDHDLDVQLAELLAALKLPITFGVGDNSVTIEADGTLAAGANATGWDDSMVPANSFRSGLSALTFDALTTNLYCYRIDTSDEVHLITQFPHKMKVNTVIKPHVHLINKTGIGATNYNVGLELRYTWANIGSTFPAETAQTGKVVSFQNASALTHKIFSFDDITPAAGQGGISSLFICNLKRVAAAGNNYAGADIFLGGFDVHIECDTPNGSRNAASK